MVDVIDKMQRIEFKYILTKEQTEYLKEQLIGHMKVDKYGLTSIASLYYDTPDFRLIRTSLEKPKFKEKIRLRSYGLATLTSPVYLELKRKVNGIVYKRRIKTNINLVNDFFEKKEQLDDNNQIGKEITYFRDYYKNLKPVCIIIYDRVAYYEPDSNLRLTLDGNPRYRFDNLNLTDSLEGTSILPDDKTILEIKIQGAMPLWLSHILDQGQIRKGSISKYGEAYKQKISKMLEGVY